MHRVPGQRDLGNRRTYRYHRNAITTAHADHAVNDYTSIENLPGGGVPLRLPGSTDHETKPRTAIRKGDGIIAPAPPADGVRVRETKWTRLAHRNVKDHHALLQLIVMA